MGRSILSHSLLIICTLAMSGSAWADDAVASEVLASDAVAGEAAGGETDSVEHAVKGEKYLVEKIGEPKSCIRLSQIRSTDVIDNQTIDFKMRGGDIYRNRLPNSCSRLGYEKAFSYATSQTQLCKVDIIHVLNQSAGHLETQAACGLGEFQQIKKTKRPTAAE